ncbi:hypothetical protein PHISCL_11121, partial [Aspergillus sclerotialis]
MRMGGLLSAKGRPHDKDIPSDRSACGEAKEAKGRQGKAKGVCSSHTAYEMQYARSEEGLRRLPWSIQIKQAGVAEPRRLAHSRT